MEIEKLICHHSADKGTHKFRIYNSFSHLFCLAARGCFLDMGVAVSSGIRGVVASLGVEGVGEVAAGSLVQALLQMQKPCGTAEIFARVF